MELGLSWVNMTTLLPQPCIYCTHPGVAVGEFLSGGEANDPAADDDDVEGAAVIAARSGQELCPQVSVVIEPVG